MVTTNFKDSNNIDLGLQFVSKDYLISVYPNLISNVKMPGLYSFGRNLHGELGNGTATTQYSSPVQVGGLTNWEQVTSNGGVFTGAIKTDGTLWMCGYNINGQLGLGDTTDRSSPVQVGALTNWKQVAKGSQSTMAVKTDGTLWGCGYNNDGRLGDGTITKKSSPVQIGALTNWKQVSTYNQTMAIKTDGTLWAWGLNNQGMLGLGDTNNRSSPVQVGALTNWKQVAAGGRTFTVALKTDGTLWACGYGDAGQLGNGLSGSTNKKSSPIQIGSLTNWKQIACGGGHAAAIKTDGTLWAWGRNNLGQLGLGDITDRSSPIQVGALTNWKQVSCGYNYTAAIKTDGTLWAWGNDAYGQLGDGTTISKSSPVQVGLLTTWKFVGANAYHILAIKEEGGW